MTKPRLGYVGLGAMGLPFATHLRKAGYETTVFNRSDRPYAAARAANLTIADSLEVCVASSDILFTCLPSSSIIDDVYARIDKPGLICCDNSTVPPEQAIRLNKDLNERGMVYVECPIFGSAQDAIDAQVYLIASGDCDAVERILPIAGRAARAAVRVGGTSAASLMKVLQNGLGHVQMVAMAETLVAAERAGLDPALFVDVVSNCGGMASTSLFQRKAPQMLNPPSKTNAKLAIAAKDAKAAATISEEIGMPEALVTHSAKAYERALSKELGDNDFSAIIEAIRDAD